MSLEIVVTMNPEAVEIHRDGRSIGTIRWETGDYVLMMPARDGAAVIPFDVLALALEFGRLNRRTQTMCGGW